MRPDDAIADAYDRVAADYARLLPDLSAEHPCERGLIDDLTHGLPIAARVLDAGCGSGRMLTHLGTVRPDVDRVGVDISPAMVAEARRAAPLAELHVGRIDALPFADASLDAVIAWYSIIHTPPQHLPTFFAEVRRVMRDGGRLVMGFQAGAGTRHIERGYGHRIDLLAHLHDPDLVAGAARSAGFIDVAALLRARAGDERFDQGFVTACG